jgi:hypothetical protein
MTDFQGFVNNSSICYIVNPGQVKTSCWQNNIVSQNLLYFRKFISYLPINFNIGHDQLI